MSKESAKQNIIYELDILQTVSDTIKSKKISKLRDELKSINQSLWDLEDAIRKKEAAKSFDEEFVIIARNTYLINDKRAIVKKLINSALNSDIIEEKNILKYSLAKIIASIFN